ncbi:Gp37 family protein [Patescibacteria group bacterium]|nr:Gp37 family protein [Patescibacteria group bacterium]
MNETRYIDTWIEGLEDEIKKALESELNGVTIDTFPEKPDEYYYKNKQGTVLVICRSGNYENQSKTRNKIQSLHLERLTIELTIGCFSRRGEHGALKLMNNCRRILSGKFFNGYTRIVPISWNLNGVYNNRVWEFVQTFEVDSMYSLGE